MNLEERIEHVAKELAEYAADEKKLKGLRNDAKDEFFKLIRERHQHSILPVRTIEIPVEFFASTDMSYEEFVESRFPGWLVEHIERNISTDYIVFVLKRDPMYISDAVEVDGLRVSKVVSEYTPEIDWETLQKERPDVFDKLAEPQLVYNVNEENLERMMEESPEELAILQRHMRVKKPALKVTSRKVKDGRD